MLHATADIGQVEIDAGSVTGAPFPLSLFPIRYPCPSCGRAFALTTLAYHVHRVHRVTVRDAKARCCGAEVRHGL